MFGTCEKRIYGTSDDCMQYEIIDVIGDDYIDCYDLVKARQQMIDCEGGDYFIRPEYDEEGRFWNKLRTLEYPNQRQVGYIMADLRDRCVRRGCGYDDSVVFAVMREIFVFEEHKYLQVVIKENVNLTKAVNLAARLEYQKDESMISEWGKWNYENLDVQVTHYVVPGIF